jgi:RecA-family ATPase
LTKRQATGEVVATDVTSRIMAMARHLNDLRLIVIDPASRFRGGDENKNEDATRFVEALEALAKQTGASVLIAHHASKASLSPDSDPSQGASRGASALTDGLRWQMNLNKPNNSQVKKWAIPAEDHRNHVVATVTKTNYSAFPEPVLMRRTDEGYLEAVNAKLAQLQSEQAAVMRVLRILATAKRPMSARKLEEHHGGIDGDLKMPKQTVREIVKTCIEQGLLGGGARKPLQVTALGESALKAGGQSAEEASGRAKTAPRDETQ